MSPPDCRLIGALRRRIARQTRSPLHVATGEPDNTQASHLVRPMWTPRRHQIEGCGRVWSPLECSAALRGGRACAEGRRGGGRGFDEGFGRFGCAAAGPLLIDNTYRALEDHQLEGRYVWSLFPSRQMLPPDPAKLEQRAGRRLDGDRGLGDSDHPTIGDQQGGAGEVDPCPYRRHAVKLVGRPAEHDAWSPQPSSTNRFRPSWASVHLRGRQSGGELGVGRGLGRFPAGEDAQEVGLGRRENGDDVRRRRGGGLVADAAIVAFGRT